MKVKLRHIDDADAVDFCEVGNPAEIEGVIAFIQRSGGVYCNGIDQPFHSYQLVLDSCEAYAEILIGEDEEPKA